MWFIFSLFSSCSRSSRVHGGLLTLTHTHTLHVPIDVPHILSQIRDWWSQRHTLLLYPATLHCSDISEEQQHSLNNTPLPSPPPKMPTGFPALDILQSWELIFKRQTLQGRVLHSASQSLKAQGEWEHKIFSWEWGVGDIKVSRIKERD